MDKVKLVIALEDNIPDMNNVVSLISGEFAHPLENLLERKQKKKRPRNSDYYEVTIPHYQDNLFKEHFRMSKSTFQVNTVVVIKIIIKYIIFCGRSSLILWVVHSVMKFLQWTLTKNCYLHYGHFQNLKAFWLLVIDLE